MKIENMTNRDKLREIVFNYLETASSMRYGATHAQLKAAAKKIVASGNLPLPVVEAIRRGPQHQVIGRVA